MQQSNTQPARNQTSAAAIPSKVAVPERSAPGTPSSGSGNGHAAGSSVKGFSGGLKPGKC